MNYENVVFMMNCSIHKYKLPTKGCLYIIESGIYFEQIPFNESAPEREFIFFEDIKDLKIYNGYLSSSLFVQTVDKDIYFCQFDSLQEAYMIINFLYTQLYKKTVERIARTDTNVDERSEKLVRDTNSAIKKGEGALESLARQEETENKINEKLEEIDNHMTLSNRLLRGMGTIGVSVQNIVTYPLYTFKNAQNTSKDGDVVQMKTTRNLGFNYRDTFPVLLKGNNKNFELKFLGIGKDNLEVIDLNTREVLINVRHKRIKSIMDDEHTPCQCTITIGAPKADQTIHLISDQLPKITSALLLKNDLIESQSTTPKTLHDLSLHFINQTRTTNTATTARQNNLNQLSQSLHQVQVISHTMNQALDSSNIRIKQLSQHTDSTKNQVDQTSL
ncbi:hypothetical protein AKO1_009040, partial [Acrasis kona]